MEVMLFYEAVIFPIFCDLYDGSPESVSHNPSTLPVYPPPPLCIQMSVLSIAHLPTHMCTSSPMVLPLALCCFLDVYLEVPPRREHSVSVSLPL